MGPGDTSVGTGVGSGDKFAVTVAVVDPSVGFGVGSGVELAVGT